MKKVIIVCGENEVAKYKLKKATKEILEALSESQSVSDNETIKEFSDSQKELDNDFKEALESLAVKMANKTKRKRL